jgi:toxin ParE1/3/4
MSRPDALLILSPQAEDDFADIIQYTLETWGEAQTLCLT